MSSSTSIKPSTPIPRSLYHALDKKSQQFRLLRIHPGQKSQIVKCDLYIAVLKRRMGFEALSYVWGDPEPTTDILINKARFPVRANLRAAFRRLRRSDEDRILWVDAICINQTDDEEKGHQVNLMSRIYTFATTVIAWLGDVPPPHEPSCVELFNRIRKQKDKILKPRGRVYSEDYIECTEKLMTSSWFSRVWIIQESVLSRDLRMMLGPADASFQDVCDIADNLIRMLEKQGINVSNEYWRIEDMRKKKSYPSGRGVNFLNALIHAWNFQATDRRDLVYALLGTVNDWQAQTPMLADYTIDERQVIINTSVQIIRCQKSLQLLVPAGLFCNRNYSRPIPPNCPSWVSPFSRGTLVYATEGYNSRPFVDDLQLVDRELLSLDATFLGTVDMLSQNRFPDLQVSSWLGKQAERYEGELFDDIENMMEVPRLLDFVLASERLVRSKKYYDEPSVVCLRQIFHQYGGLVKDALRRTNFQLPTDEDPEISAFELLNAFLHSQLLTSREKSEIETMDIDAYYAAVETILKRTMGLWACWSRLDEYNAKSPLPLTPGWWCFSEHIADTTKLREGDNMQEWLRGRARRLVRTDKGAAFALAGYAEPGDKIFNLGGKSGLFVLRSDRKRTVKTVTKTGIKIETIETYKLVEKCLAFAALEDFDGTPAVEKPKKVISRVHIC